MVDVFVLGQLAIVQVHAVRPLAADIAVALIHFVPPVPIDDLIVPQESLEHYSVRNVSLKATFFHHLFEPFCIDLLLQFFGVVVSHSFDVMLFELLFDDLVLVVLVVEDGWLVGWNWGLEAIAYYCLLAMHHVF